MSWNTRKSLNIPRSHPAVTSWRGKIYAIGGGGPDFKSLNSVEVYDPETDSWEFTSEMPTTRSGAVAKTINGRIYVIGGGYKKPDGKFCFLPKVEIYDIEKNSWTNGPDMIESHDYPAAAVLANEIYIMAGHHPTATEGGPKTDPGSSFCEKLNINGNGWQAVPPVSVPRFGATAHLVNSQIWVMGGVALSDAGFNNYDIIEILDPAKPGWRQQENLRLPWPAAAHGSAYHNNRLYVMGGYSGAAIHDLISSLDCSCLAKGAKPLWTSLPAMPQAKAAIGVTICNGEIYTIGGWASDGRTPIDSVTSIKCIA